MSILKEDLSFIVMDNIARQNKNGKLYRKPSKHGTQGRILRMDKKP